MKPKQVGFGELAGAGPIAAEEDRHLVIQDDGDHRPQHAARIRSTAIAAGQHIGKMGLDYHAGRFVIREQLQFAPEALPLADHGLHQIGEGLSLHRDALLHPFYRVVPGRERAAHCRYPLRREEIGLDLPCVTHEHDPLTHAAPPGT